MTGSTAPEIVLEAESLVAGYVPGVDILNGLTLAVRSGEIVTVIGPNGAGKSTLIKVLVGLLPPRRGRVVLRGRDLAGMRPHAIARLGVGHVPQLDNVFPSLTVQENLVLGAAAATGALDLRARLAELYGLFPRLAERRRQPAGTMSGGERQMVAMARALVPEPTILLLDEPSAGLAPVMVDAVFARVAAVNARGVTILMVEQNARRALAMSHRGYVLDLGRNRFTDAGQALLADPRIAEIYLGGRASGDSER